MIDIQSATAVISPGKKEEKRKKERKKERNCMPFVWNEIN